MNHVFRTCLFLTFTSNPLEVVKICGGRRPDVVSTNYCLFVYSARSVARQLLHNTYTLHILSKLSAGKLGSRCRLSFDVNLTLEKISASRRSKQSPLIALQDDQNTSEVMRRYIMFITST